MIMKGGRMTFHCPAPPRPCVQAGGWLEGYAVRWWCAAS